MVIKKFLFTRSTLLIIGVSILIVLLFAYRFFNYTYTKNVVMDTEHRVLLISSGIDFNTLSDDLSSQGFIQNQASFEWVAGFKNYKNNIKPGRFTIQNGWNNNQLINHIRLTSNSIPVHVTFNNISRITQLASVISTQIEADSSELMLAFLDTLWMKENGVNPQTLSSIFIPNTYEFYWNSSGKQFATRMGNEFKQYWNKVRRAKADSIGLTPIEVSTLASIIESETKQIDELPKVAGLYLNRLKRGMRLQSDPTVVFALNDPQTQRVYLADLKIESPYNTYIHRGLPPGPIRFPSIHALDAVLNSFPSKYVYMCAKPDYSGRHNFAISYRQHQRNAAIYHSFLRRKGIR